MSEHTPEPWRAILDALQALVDLADDADNEVDFWNYAAEFDAARAAIATVTKGD